jgi:hypothetical protein
MSQPTDVNTNSWRWKTLLSAAATTLVWAPFGLNLGWVVPTFGYYSLLAVLPVAQAIIYVPALGFAAGLAVEYGALSAMKSERVKGTYRKVISWLEWVTIGKTLNTKFVEELTRLSESLVYATNVLRATLNFNESALGANFICYALIYALKEIRDKVENDDKVIGFDETTKDWDSYKEYIKVKGELSLMLDDIVRLCRFRIRRGWMESFGYDLKDKSREDKMIFAYDRIAQFMLKNTATNAINRVQQRGPLSSPLDKRPEYMSFITRVLNLYDSINKNDVWDETKFIELRDKVIKEPKIGLENRLVYTRDNFSILNIPIAENMTRLLTVIVGAIVDYSLLTNYEDRTPYAPRMFYRKLIMIATLYMRPAELLLSDEWWMAVYLLLPYLLDKVLEVDTLKACKARARLINLYKTYKKKKEDGVKFIGPAVEYEELYSLVFTIQKIIGDNTWWTPEDRKRLIKATSNQTSMAYKRFYYALDKRDNPATKEECEKYVLADKPAEQFPLAIAAFRLFKIDTMPKPRKEYQKQVSYRAQLCSMTLVPTWTFELDARDSARWEYLGYLIRSEVTTRLPHVSKVMNINDSWYTAIRKRSQLYDKYEETTLRLNKTRKRKHSLLSKDIPSDQVIQLFNHVMQS